MAELTETEREISDADRLTIIVNDDLTLGKAAAAAVHAALAHYDIQHGAVVVLRGTKSKIASQCGTVIRDAGKTEVSPGTVTAGVRRGPDAILSARIAEARAEGAREVINHVATLREKWCLGEIEDDELDDALTRRSLVRAALAEDGA